MASPTTSTMKDSMMTKNWQRRIRKSTSVSIAEQEVVVRLDRQSGQAHICSSWPMWSQRLEKRYGRPTKVSKVSKDGEVSAAFWDVPIGLITFRKSGKSGKGNAKDLERARAAKKTGRSSRDTLKTFKDREPILARRSKP